MKIDKMNYVDTAETVVGQLRKDKKGKNIRLTTSKIRNILAMVSEIYNEVIHEKGEKLSGKSQERIQYLRLRITYEAGRDDDVKDFVDKSELLQMLKKIGNNKEEFLLFCRYLEALVAYHRFYGGRDK
jgi:CRISPR-associated protein Csm2